MVSVKVGKPFGPLGKCRSTELRILVVTSFLGTKTVAVDTLEHTPKGSREACLVDRTCIALDYIGNHSFFQTANRLDHLAEQ